MYLISLQPDPRESLVNCLSSACRRSTQVQGQCLNEGVLELKNEVRKPFAGALSRVSSLALAASCSASIALDGLFFLLVGF
jgi:hypothetical protein